ncbi:hypothetical protein WJX72_009418 [[Myrmecia] bisecta]|uniref:Phospholipase A-2-activating protein n=1 Tax=[Myrmecia] bisecta TaxID=41462 RepID=A0AAW1P6I1_9CHLO
MTDQDYQLRCELRGHEEDVRGLCVCDLGLITGSRDKTVKIWHEEGPNSFSVVTTLVGHTDFVGPVAYIAPGLAKEFPSGAVVSGSRDTNVIVWDSNTTNPLHVLQGHSYQVTGLAVLSNGDLVSASLDKTLRVWRNGKCLHVLEGHEGPVLCVLALPNGDILSGSGDKTIKLWSDYKCVHTFGGHTDTVRGLALIPGLGVVSASHDQTLRVWTFGGECISELVGHSALVYSARASSHGLIASASEDNTARIWRADGSCIQTIPHPACVWDVEFLANGDLVTACGDYAARVWTTAEDRQAPAEARQAYEASLEAKKAGGVEGSGGALPAGLTLEDASVLTQPGTRDGQTKVVREGGAGVAYSWDAARGQWEKVGEVMGGPGEGSDTMAVGSKWHNGQQYDFVFDVDIEDGTPPKKLAVNRGDNPYDAADRFIDNENLPATYREQIVNFILQNTGGTVALPAIPMQNVDPFTGTGAYVPGAGVGGVGQPPHTVTGGSADPFTGAGAYAPSASQPPSRPAASPTPMQGATGGGVDPFTGASSRSRAARLRHVPGRQFMIFDNPPKLDGIASKMREFSATLASAQDTASMALSHEEMAPGGALEQLLARAANAAGAQGSSVGFSDIDYDLLSRMLRWPAGQLFPALDIARLAILDQQAAARLAATAGPVELSPLGDIGAALACASDEPHSASNQQTGLRLVCNCFRHEPLRRWVQTHSAALLDGFAPACASPAKAVRLAMGTLLFNLAMLFSASAGDEAADKAQVLSALVELLAATPPGEADTLFRSLVAVGTLVQNDKAALDIAQGLGFLQHAQELRQKAGAASKVAEAAQDVENLLS